MEEYFVTYEQALRLKELGFDRKCHYHYDTTAYKPAICPNYTANDGEGGGQWIYADDCNLYEDMNHCQYCSAPTLAQAQRWLREKKNLQPEPQYLSKDKWLCVIKFLPDGAWVMVNNEQEYFSSYEDALSVGITKAINLLSE